MTFEELMESWSKDCEVDFTNIGTAALDIAKLHSKYYKIYIGEKSKYLRQVEQHKKLRLDKYEFLTMGPTEETKNLGWRLPPQGRILKAEVQQYLDADPDIQASNLKMALMKEKVDFLDSIIKSLPQRGWNLKVALEHLKFVNGA